MLDSLITFLTDVILPLGPWGVFLASLIEEIIAPIPSAVVMLGGGFLFVRGPFGLDTTMQVITHVALPAALGVAIGSLVIYSIARYASNTILVSWGKLFGISNADINTAHEYFSNSGRDDLAVFIARVIPVVPAVVIAIGAGLIRMPLKRYMSISILGTMIRAFILGVIGWQSGELYITYAHTIQSWEHIMWVIVALFILGVMIRFYTRKARNRQHGNL